MNVAYTTMNTPIGKIRVAWSDEGLVGVSLGSELDANTPDPAWKHDTNLRCQATEQLQAYFEGQLQKFDLPLVLSGTPFQEKVWRTLADIPFGVTWSYSDLAEKVGKPRAVRAVGAANGCNPIPIVLPCHRVIGRGGELRGYGGGVDIKEKLLRLEGARPVNLRLF
jgi:O-6-methylguanine DNA methyltransferase